MKNANNDRQMLDAAQDLMWSAWDTPDKRTRVALAKKALGVSPLCADAYTMLALETCTAIGDRIDMFGKAVVAGEKALGKKSFREFAGHFWGFVETRPYMRARHYLGMALWDAKRGEEAIENYKGMLELNPNDNQGVRYLLLDCLLALGLNEEADRLLKRYDEGSAAWSWSRALLAFRTGGDTAATRKLLTKALASNVHVAGFLLKHKAMPRSLPPFIGIGDENEAAAYVHAAAPTWAQDPNALAWVAEQSGARRDTTLSSARRKRGAR